MVSRSGEFCVRCVLLMAGALLFSLSSIASAASLTLSDLASNGVPMPVSAELLDATLVFTITG